jgi:TolA-binding protein
MSGVAATRLHQLEARVEYLEQSVEELEGNLKQVLNILQQKNENEEIILNLLQKLSAKVLV